MKAQGLLEVRSEISDKNLYLTRPDMGRRLCAEAVEALKAQCVANPDVQVVISDGLSTDAITVNYEEILPPLMAGLKQAGLKVGTPFFVRYGRVKIEDQIGEILGAKVVILLVGERPGLGGPNPAEVRAGLDAMVAHIENGAAFQWANDAENTAFWHM